MKAFSSDSAAVGALEAIDDMKAFSSDSAAGGARDEAIDDMKAISSDSAAVGALEEAIDDMKAFSSDSAAVGALEAIDMKAFSSDSAAAGARGEDIDDTKASSSDSAAVDVLEDLGSGTIKSGGLQDINWGKVGGGACTLADGSERSGTSAGSFSSPSSAPLSSETSFGSKGTETELRSERETETAAAAFCGQRQAPRASKVSRQAKKKKKFVENLSEPDLKGKTALSWCDQNVPMNSDQDISDTIPSKAEAAAALEEGDASEMDFALVEGAPPPSEEPDDSGFIVKARQRDKETAGGGRVEARVRQLLRMMQLVLASTLAPDDRADRLLDIALRLRAELEEP
jgi:hypothetical protein